MQRAIVFGATGGIGRSICTDLAEAGWSLYIHCSSNWPAACEMSESFMKQYPSQEFLPLKFSFFAENNELEKMVQSLLPITAVIFAQGITDYHLLSDQNLDKVDEVMQVNLVTPIKLTSLLEPLLLKNDFSRIIFIGSVYGAQGSAMEAVYSATKAGLSRFSQAYAREVASANLTVNVIAPGAVDTAMNKMISVEEMAEVVGEIPAGRLASGADISFWVKALLDPNSTYLTGQTLYVSGGWLT